MLETQVAETQMPETQVPPNDAPTTFNIYDDIHVGGELFLPTENIYDQFENVEHDYRDDANVGNIEYVPTVDHNDAHNHTSCSNTRDCVSIPQQRSSSSKFIINRYMHLESSESECDDFHVGQVYDDK